MIRTIVMFLAMTVGWAYTLDYILRRWHVQEGLRIAEDYANHRDKERDK